MKRIQIYDPALCCSTGVCGPSVDETLITFAGATEWLKENGIELERYNLSQDPLAYAENEQVRQMLECYGTDALPFTFVDDKLVMVGVYPVRAQLAKLLDISVTESSEDKCDSNSSCCCG
ncbi:MAG: arsenite efflux transporter metallochaperone ArsD [Kiritimatiellia bacterium]|jgi:hypothetical protein|nr:arsenite efflux transporter metallochaperone ArsD [Kiritimatiellia bacterium]